ncbi:MAG: hypothetical protein HDT46_05760 [Ruminococcaceae bacterium]|nr:hypothetical protein [Oscillospiraceae bacterium]
MKNMLYSIILMTFEFIGQIQLAASNKQAGFEPAKSRVQQYGSRMAERSSSPYLPLKIKGFGKRNPAKKL